MKKIILLLILGLFSIPVLSNASFDLNLKYGMSGNEVSALQDLLVSEQCLAVSPTGYFGLLTMAGVQCFQSKYSINPISGYFGVLSRTQANNIVANATVISDQAEQEETGGTVAVFPCSNGQLFNTITGDPCNETAAANVETRNDVKELKEKLADTKARLERIEENTRPRVTPSPTPDSSMPEFTEPEVNIPTEVCVTKLGNESFDPEKGEFIRSKIADIPFEIKGDYWIEAEINLDGVADNGINHYGGGTSFSRESWAGSTKRFHNGKGDIGGVAVGTYDVSYKIKYFTNTLRNEVLISEDNLIVTAKDCN